MSTEIKIAIGKRIEKVRIDMNISKAQFAKLIGITPQALGLIIQGTSGCTCETIIKLCKETGISADYFLLGNSIEPPDGKALKAILSEIDLNQIYLVINSFKKIEKLIKKINFDII